MSPRLGAILEHRRERLNATFRRQGRGVDGEAFAAYLERCVDRVIQSVPEAKAEAVTIALFELGLPAMRRGMVGVGAPFEAALLELAPRLGARISAEPRRALAALGNGYLRLEEAMGPTVAMRWLHDLATAVVGGDTFYAAGLVLAWRHGLAEARDAALAHAATMPPALVEALVGGPIDASPERRFVPPGSGASLGPIALQATVGGFVGFDGDFRTPPEVHARDGQLYATDGDVVRALFADAFGARLRPTPLPLDALLEGGGAIAIEVSARGQVRWGDQEANLPELRRPTTAAAVPGLAAATLERSHHVFVLGRGPA